MARRTTTTFTVSDDGGVVAGTSATTNASGVAGAPLVVNFRPGEYAVEASFAGSNPLLPNSETEPFRVNRVPVAMTTSDDTIVGLPPPTLSATIRAGNSGAPLAGKEVAFWAGFTFVGRAVSDAAGVAQLLMTSPPWLWCVPGQASCTLWATFTGDGFYEPGWFVGSDVIRVINEGQRGR